MVSFIAFSVANVEAMEEFKLVIVVPSTSFKYFISPHRLFKYKKGYDNKMLLYFHLGFCEFVFPEAHIFTKSVFSFVVLIFQFVLFVKNLQDLNCWAIFNVHVAMCKDCCKPCS